MIIVIVEMDSTRNNDKSYVSKNYHTEKFFLRVSKFFKHVNRAI